jgi:hypothetical protein
MENELITAGCNAVEPYAPYSFNARGISVEKSRGNYTLTAPTGEQKKLTREVDFGMIRKKNGDAITKAPTLFKSGAEKIAMLYGLCQHYIVENAIEDPANSFFYFRVRCDLVKINNGTEYVITSACGSANTREGRTGSQSAYDGANSALKMAQKRALVSAALSLGCMSDCFTQDIESETGESGVYFSNDPNAAISPKQITFFYAAAGRNGLSKVNAKKFLKSHGYESAKEILQGDLDRLIDEMESGATAEVQE